MKKTFILILLFISVIACKETVTTKLQEGRWRGEFSIQDQKFPFVFEIKNISADSTLVYLINGNEKFELNGVIYSGDSITIPIDLYDAVLTGTLSNGQYQGVFKKLYNENDLGIPFTAIKTNNPRFPKETGVTSISPAGKWDIQFIGQNNDTTLNLGVFQLENEIVTGSILKKTGDFRYLEGSLTHNGFQLSAFSGSSPYLINIHFINENEFTGEFYTVNSVFKLLGTRNTEARLEDPYSLTYLKEGHEKLDFTFPDVEGKSVSLSDEKYKDKVVIVSILGSWCPNCLDEMEYLSPWYKENRERGVEIIGVAFERKDDKEYVKNTLSRLIKKYDVEYEILFGGKLSTESTAKAFPQINKVMAYPTTIFIDKKGYVRKIHTGFNGPATGVFFDEFKHDFNDIINNLLEE